MNGSLDRSARLEGEAGSVSGVTTDAYVTVVTWPCRPFGEGKNILVACDHASNDLDYKILGYVKSGSALQIEIFSETTLTHDTQQPLSIDERYDEIIVQVKSSSAGNASSYQVDYVGGL